MLLVSFLPFWLFLSVYKFAAVLHYSVLSPLGSRILPFWIVGLLVGGESFVQMLLDVPAGYLVDRFGRKKTLLFGLFSFLITAYLLTLPFTAYTFAASIAMSTFGWLFFSPGVNAYVLAYAEKETSGRFMAFRDTFLSIGVVLSSITLSFVLVLSVTQIGWIICVILAIAFVLLLISPADRPIMHTEAVLPAQSFHIRRTMITTSLRALKRLNPASGMLFASSLASGMFYGTVWFVVPLAIASHPSEKLLGLGLGIFDLTVVLLGFLLGSIVDRGNKRLLVFYGLFLYALTGLFLGFTLGPLFLLLGFLATSGEETAGLSLWSWLHSLDKEHAHDGAVSGVISLAEDFGYAVGPILSGLCYAAAGPAWTLAVGALPVTLVWFYYTFAVRVRVPLFPMSLRLIPRMPMRKRHKG